MKPSSITFESSPIAVPTRIEDVTRRGLLFGAVTATLLIACGDDVEVSEPAVEPPTRLVQTPYGAIEVPARPQRVVSLGEEFMLADLLDLGIRPIASTASGLGGFVGMAQFDVSDIETLSNTSLDLESLTALKPDLLLIYQVVAAQLDLSTINQIAPTVVVDSRDYRNSYVDLAAAFGLEAKALARLVEYDRAATAAGQALNARSRRVSVATVYPGATIAVWVGGPTALPQALLDMGFTLVPDATSLPPTSGNNRAYISLEGVSVLSGEDLLLCQSSAIEGEDDAVKQVTSTDTWQLLPAVTRGRVHTIDRLGFPGIPGRITLIRHLAEALA